MPEKSTVKKVFRILRYITLAVSLILFLIVGYFFWQWHSQPDYWKDNEAFVTETEPEQLEQLANIGERKVLGSLSGETVRDVQLSLDEANAWLAIRLDKWVANQGIILPKEIKSYMVSTEDQRIVVAFHAQQDDVEQVISLLFDAWIDDAGKANIKLFELRAGSLPVSAETFAKHFGSRVQGQAKQQLNRLINGVQIDPTFVNPTNRSQKLTVEAIEIDDQMLRLRMRSSANR